MNENMKGLLELLGEKEIHRLKSGITDVILEKIKDDIDDEDMYWIDSNVAESLMEEVHHEIKQEIKDILLAKYKAKIDAIEI